jgi:hypothetical protein
VRTAALILFLILPGVLATSVSGHFLFQDWHALSIAFTRFETAATQGAELRTLFVAAEMDRVYRTNCLADGLGVMLGMLLAGLGIHGLCASRPRVVGIVTSVTTDLPVP